MEWFVQIHKKIKEWEWYTDMPTCKLFFHILLSANYKKANWRGNEILPWQFITSLEHLANDSGLSIQQVRTALEKLISTNEITRQSTSLYTILTLNNWESYNTPDNKPITNEQQTNNKPITTTNNNNTEYKENKEYIETDTTIVVWDKSLVVEHWSEHINLMQWFLRQAVWVTAFKDSKERWYVTHCYNLMKKIGKEEFNSRLETILSDQFKAKNCNKLAYLYWEIKSFIHSPIIKTKERESALDITL